MYEIKEVEPVFVPVKVTLEFHTQKELDAFGKLFNVGCVIEALRTEGVDMPSEPLYSVFQDAGANISPIGPLRSNIRRLA